MNNQANQLNFNLLVEKIRSWGAELGFQQIGISDIHLHQYEKKLRVWLENNYHGEMKYMATYEQKRSHPEQLIPGTYRIITARMNYLPPHTGIISNLQDPNKGYIARYALGKDYHKLIRKRLQQLAAKITHEIGPFGYRAFTDSAPVLEKALAEKAGLGWIGKNTLLLNKEAGSWFFLGELYTDLPLPLENVIPSDHCGSCKACLNICPTQAFIAPYVLDARRCISYLTIEYKGSIPLELRPLMGNRIFGCDDCQLVCPWNCFAKPTDEIHFSPRHGLESLELIALFNWTEQEFLQKTQGSAIRRIGYESWLRNIAVALGNAPACSIIVQALEQRLDYPSTLVQEHIQWALQQQSDKINGRVNLKKLIALKKLNSNYE